MPRNTASWAACSASSVSPLPQRLAKLHPDAADLHQPVDLGLGEIADVL
jgi:hypothetical protein